MRRGIIVNLTSADRRKLKAIIANREAPPKHVSRASILLATAEGCGTAEIMRRTGKSKAMVWRWQARFMAEGVAGLTRDKPRGPGKPALPAPTVQRVIDLALGPPPVGSATRWTSRMLAKAAGVSLGSVQRIVKAHQLAPYRSRTFTLLNDPTFRERLEDIVGLYVDPPAHAVVFALGNTTPLKAPSDQHIKPGRAGAATRDYRPRGFAMLFAALGVLDGRASRRPRHEEFIRFLDEVNAQVPRRKTLCAVVDTDPIHKHPKLREWLVRHSCWTFHSTPATASWQHAVGDLLANSAHHRLKRDVVRSISDLRYALDRFIAEVDHSSKPFVWTAEPKRAIGGRRRKG